MVLKLASFLDPRFKTKYFSSEEVESIPTKLEMESIHLQSHAPDPANTSQECLPPSKKKLNLGTVVFCFF